MKSGLAAMIYAARALRDLGALMMVESGWSSCLMRRRPALAGRALAARGIRRRCTDAHLEPTGGERNANRGAITLA